MEEQEIPLENLHEEMHHKAHEGEQWITRVALSAAIFAVLAAIASLLTGDHSNEAVIKEIDAANQWSYYQAKSIKRYLLEYKVESQASASKEEKEKDLQKIREYVTEGKEIMEKAQDKEKEAAYHLKHHVVLARSVTLFQIAIAISAIAALTKRKKFWYVGLVFGVVGCVIMAQGLFL